ncbi:MAG: hypothetical protein V4722_26805 [Bacteroidota bacterium]
MQKKPTLFIVAALLLLSAMSYAQPAQKPPAAKSDTSKGPLQLIPSFGAYTNGSKAFAADIKRLLTVNPPLKLKDSKGVTYNIVSFEITWKKKDVSDDIRSGKQKTVYYYVGGDIKGAKLTDSWKEEISNYIQKGEELTFGTILYFDPKRKVNSKAPSIVISIQ